MLPESESPRVLDSWALMAWLNGEQPAAAKVQALLDRAEAGRALVSMNMVNVGEVYYLLARRRGQQYASSFWEDLQTSRVVVCPAPNDLILDAARWKSRHPVSYADAFAAATAIRDRGVLVTGDRERRGIGAGDTTARVAGRL